MPGMWDCHCHLHGISRFSLEDMLITPVPTAAARAAKDAEAALQAGFTSLREAGGMGIWLVPAIEEGTVNGPSIYSAGSVLSQTGGHADVHSLPAGWVASACEDGRFLQLCDGVPECLRVVWLQLRKNAKVIKVCASGGVASIVDDPVHQQFSDEELRAIVSEAARAGRAVMAHCHGKPGIMAALRAGAHSIEHGSYLDEEAAAAMREAGAILVPTRSIIERMLAGEDKVPPPAYRKIPRHGRPAPGGNSDRPCRRGHYRCRNRHRYDRSGQLPVLGQQRHRASAPPSGRPVAARRDRGGDGERAADPWPAGATVRPAATRFRRRPAGPGPQSP